MIARATALWLALACSACAVAVAQPAPEAQREQASQHFDRALELIEQGAYPEAVVQFERAYELSGDDAVLHNLGMAYIAAGRHVEAVATLERYLAREGEQLELSERTRIATELERQRARIGHLTIQGLPDGASIKIDGREQGVSPLDAAVPLLVGEHSVEVSHPDDEQTAAKLEIHAREQATLVMALRPAPILSVAAVPLESPIHAPSFALRAQGASSRNDAQPQQILGCVLGTTGAVTGIVALTIRLVSWHRLDDWEKEDKELAGLASATDPATERRRQENDALLKSVWQLDTLTLALGITGGVLLAGGVTVLWLGQKPDQSEAPRAHVALRGSGVELGGRF